MAVDATVVDVGAGGAVELAFAAPEGCSGCAGSCTWRRVQAGGRARFRSDLPVAPGEKVRVSLPAGQLLSGVLLLHGVPLLSLLSGGALGAALTQTDAGCLAGAAAGLAAALAATAPLRRRAERLTIERARLERVP